MPLFSFSSKGLMDYIDSICILVKGNLSFLTCRLFLCRADGGASRVIFGWTVLIGHPLSSATPQKGSRTSSRRQVESVRWLDCNGGNRQEEGNGGSGRRGIKLSTISHGRRDLWAVFTINTLVRNANNTQVVYWGTPTCLKMKKCHRTNSPNSSSFLWKIYFAAGRGNTIMDQ